MAGRRLFGIVRDAGDDGHAQGALKGFQAGMRSGRDVVKDEPGAFSVSLEGAQGLKGALQARRIVAADEENGGCRLEDRGGERRKQRRHIEHDEARLPFEGFQQALGLFRREHLSGGGGGRGEQVQP